MSNERETRYADALRTSIRDYTGVPDMDEVWNFSLVKAAGVQAPAVMAVADAEREQDAATIAELRAEVERLRMQHEASQGALSDLLTEHREDAEALQRGLVAVEAIEPHGSDEWVESGEAMKRTILHTIRAALAPPA